MSSFPMLAASPGFFWAMAAIGKLTKANKTNRLFITDWTRGQRPGFKEKSFRQRPFGGDKPLVAAGERKHIAISHALSRIRSQHRTIPAAAIHNYFRLAVGHRLFQVAFQNAFAEVNGLCGAARQPFAVL